MFGLAGFVVLGVEEIGGELEVTVETTESRTGCPRCGVVAVLHDRRVTVVRDVDGFDQSVRLGWRKRVWRCHEPLCEQVTWTETSAGIAARAVLTERARRRAVAERAAATTHD